MGIISSVEAITHHFVSRTVLHKTFPSRLASTNSLTSHHYVLLIRSQKPYWQPVITCASTFSHSWRSKTLEAQKGKLTFTLLVLGFWEQLRGCAQCGITMVLIVFLSQHCALPLEQKRSYIRIICRRVLVNPLVSPSLWPGGVLSLHSRSSKTCLISTIQVSVKVEPEDLNSL